MKAVRSLTCNELFWALSSFRMTHSGLSAACRGEETEAQRVCDGPVQGRRAGSLLSWDLERIPDS